MNDKRAMAALASALDEAHNIGYQAGAAAGKQTGDLAIGIMRLEDGVSKLQESVDTSLDYQKMSDADLLKLASSRGFDGEEVRGLACDELIRRHGQSAAVKLIRGGVK